MFDQSLQQDVAALLPWRKGHFRFESGHHGDTWLYLELLCHHPEPVERLAISLADRLAAFGPDMICGPLVEGAFVALMVSRRLGLPFAYTERVDPQSDRLFSVTYTVPGALRDAVRGKGIVIVNDVIGAGSAVLGTLNDLRACGAEPIAIGTLAVRGALAVRLARDNGVALETLASFPGDLWKPEECPLCAAGAPLLSS